MSALAWPLVVAACFGALLWRADAWIRRYIGQRRTLVDLMDLRERIEEVAKDKAPVLALIELRDRVVSLEMRGE